MTIKDKLDRPVFIFILCWLAYAISYMGRMNFAIAIPVMEKAGIASLGELGLAGSLYFWSYACGHLVNGTLGDFLSPRLMIFMGLILSALANLGITLFPQPIIIMILWSLNGFSLSMLWGPIIRLLGERISSSHQNTVSLLMSVSIGVGSFTAWFALGAAIAHFDNWMYAFRLPAIVCSVFSILWLFFSRATSSKHLKAHPDEGTKVEEPKREGFLAVFWRTRLYLIIIAAMIQGMIKDGLTLWLPTLMQVRFPGESADSLMGKVALIPFINVAGILLIAILLKKKKINYRRTTLFLFIQAAVVLLFLFKWNFTVPITISMLGLLSCIIAFINSIILSLVPMQYRRSKRMSTVAGLLDFVAYFAAGIFSIFSGLFFQSSSDWSRIFLVLLCGVLLGAGVMLPAKKEIRA